ncbi:MAG TPA: hypothetical protein VNM67_06220 [Thermoanaerobaculia bacterium]|nr:hypothetical protein [Thermoanaerobaculia bacterium]
MAPLIVLIVVTLLARLAGQLGVRPLRSSWSPSPESARSSVRSVS